MKELCFDSLPPGPPFEQHYSVQKVAKMWNLGVDVIRKIFDQEPDVIHAGSPDRLHRRRYFTLRIPESVLRRVHRKLSTTGHRPN